MPDVARVFEKIRDRELGGANVRRAARAAVVSVATARTLLLPANPNRIAYMVSNKDGTNTVHVDWSPDVSTTRGIPLGPKDTLSDRYTESGETVQDALYAIAEAAACDVYVQEWEVY